MRRNVRTESTECGDNVFSVAETTDDLPPIDRNQPLAGRVAVVTGGNSGIGKAAVLALAAEGANVVIDWVAHPEATEEAYDKVMAVNLKSAFFGTQVAARQMISQGDGGRIINMSSVHEDWPMTGNTAYCLSKGGMRMLTRTAGVELAEHGINVVGVGPGAVATPINASTMADPEKMKVLDAAIPIGRMAEPSEIGDVVAFLAGPRATYLTAMTIMADGGLIQSSPGL